MQKWERIKLVLRKACEESFNYKLWLQPSAFCCDVTMCYWHATRRESREKNCCREPQILHCIWCDFDRASSLICGNKMPTRCNRGFYCRSYCWLNMFRAPLCPSSGAQEFYTVVADCGILCCGFQVAGLVRSWGFCVQFAGCCSILQHNPQLQQLENHSTKHHRQQPLYNTLELLMMGIVVPETCWASNKICNKNLCCN